MCSFFLREGSDILASIPGIDVCNLTAFKEEQTSIQLGELIFENGPHHSSFFFHVVLIQFIQAVNQPLCC